LNRTNTAPEPAAKAAWISQKWWRASVSSQPPTQPTSELPAKKAR
jgi:hypothetical protein